MIQINDIPFDFDVTSPLDLKRYQDAGSRMEENAKALELPPVDPDSPGFIPAYIDMLNGQLQLYGNFLDDVLGEGAAEKLLTNNPSLNRVLEISDKLSDAIAESGKQFHMQLKKYTPDTGKARK